MNVEETETGLNFSPEIPTKQESEDRLLKVLEVLEQSRHPAVELQKLTVDGWYDFFEENLPGFREFINESHALSLVLESKVMEQIKNNRSDKIDWDPCEGLALVEHNSVRLDIWTPNMPAFLKVYLTNMTTYNALPENVQRDIEKQVLQKFFDARTNNRALVVIYNDNPISPVGGFGIVPTDADMEGTGALIPMPCFAPDWDLTSIEDGARFDQWLQARDLAALKVSELSFYESLRLQVAARCGVRCPFLRPGQPCCGRGGALRQLFEAGQKAAMQGWPFIQWEMSPECRGESSDS